MTIANTNSAHAGRRPSLFSRIGGFFVAYGEAQSRSDQITALTALTDEQLAARGLDRARIVAHVYADKLYL